LNTKRVKKKNRIQPIMPWYISVDPGSNPTHSSTYVPTYREYLPSSWYDTYWKLWYINTIGTMDYYTISRTESVITTKPRFWRERRSDVSVRPNSERTYRKSRQFQSHVIDAGESDGVDGGTEKRRGKRCG
jgi:hypothetical protein